jgi:hypothetical protein
MTYRKLFGRYYENIKINIIIVAFVLVGFWGPQISRFAGIDFGSTPFTAVYFQDPEIVVKGIAAGDKIAFGIVNGDSVAHKIAWHIKSGNTDLKSGFIEVPSNSSKLIVERTTGAVNGSKLEIFAGDLKFPITVSVVG